MSKKLKSGQWVRSYVVRGGTLKDKHNNITKKPITLRQRSTGIVIDKYGNFKGFEKPHHNLYGQDIHKGKKPKGWHGESIRHSLARSGIHTKR